MFLVSGGGVGLFEIEHPIKEKNKGMHMQIMMIIDKSFFILITFYSK